MSSTLYKTGLAGARMFERFTDRARRAVVRAQEEARTLDRDYVGPDHLLLGLTHESTGGTAASVLQSLGVGPEAARQRVAWRRCCGSAGRAAQPILR
jgi:ATP-dependent Clp protease ATP-binding subunit ClpA